VTAGSPPTAGEKEGLLAAIAGTAGIISAAQAAPASFQFFTFELSNCFKLLRAFELHNAARRTVFNSAACNAVPRRDTASARRELEAIVHPAVHRAIAAGIRGFELLGDPLVIVDVPLLYETGAEKGFDRVIVTACATDRQLARLVDRGLTVDAARQRIGAQWPTEKKAARADFVIATDGTFEETNAQIDRIHRALIS